jgi:anthranilate synthase/aminodeoxychorismate synthase-like glutamine amidotransferase
MPLLCYVYMFGAPHVLDLIHVLAQPDRFLLMFGTAYKRPADEIESLAPERIIISPGPGTPSEAGLSKEVVAHFGPKLPLLGVCLGHQSIGEVYGAKVVRAERMMHGKTSAIHHDGEGVFAGLPNPMVCTRYHSLIVPEQTLPEDLVPCAWTRDADHPPELMGVRHRTHPVHGVQFHPESFLSPEGTDLLTNFLNLDTVMACQESSSRLTHDE